MELKVTFKPENINVAALPGNTILELAREANIDLSAVCGGGGTCGKCRVEIVDAPEPNGIERAKIPAERLAAGVRLACQTKVRDRDLTVIVPDTSRLFNIGTLVSGFTREVPFNPGVKKCHLVMTAPTIDDQRSDWERIVASIREAVPGSSLPEPTAEITLLQEMPGLLRENNFEVTAVLSGNKVLALEAGDTSGDCLGVAFDLGTTTLVGCLVDFNTARELAVAYRGNPQAGYGADVINRINFALSEEAAGRKLQEAVTGALREIIGELCRSAGVSPEHIYEVMAVGNTVMEHLFLGVPVGALAVSPYVSAFNSGLTLTAGTAGLPVNRDAVIRTAPVIRGFIGGDTVAGILATNQHRERPLRLFIDVGTNGELVAGNYRGLWCASTAAGPAFEGATIHCGMRAEPGAVDKVRIRETVEYTTIKEEPARGICGTGLIDGVSELLKAGVITANGRLRSREETTDLSPGVRERLGREGGEHCFYICPGNKVAIYQKDIRQVQMAKAAIAAGVEILLKKIAISLDEIDEVFLAGAFGAYINPEAALRIGLLPPVAVGKIRFLGNTALTGAKMMLVSEDMRNEAEKLPAAASCVELFHEQKFMETFVNHLSFSPPNPP